ncbi:hypothetical protein [Micromonospora sp. NPDC049662]|uniref:hypothetical protein n=1 Tax=Micromonospora sp. NPDC049662 TaxID=3155397 RepID=UPI0034392539
MRDRPNRHIVAAVGERWTRVISPDDDGPYPALVRPDTTDRGLIALFTRDTMAEMVRDMDQATGTYGGLSWATGEPDILLVHQDADDDDPTVVRPDARGLYDPALGIDFWREHRSEKPAVVRGRHDSPHNEQSTCDTCGRPIQRRAGRSRWWHVTGDDAVLGCGWPGEHYVATPTRPGSTLRVLVLALLAAGVSEVTLYDDGFEIDGPDDVQLVFVRGSFTPQEVGALLGLPADAIDDERTDAPPPGPADNPSFLRHSLTTVGDALAWRYDAESGVPEDPSDHYWLSALGVDVMIRRRPGGVYVSVEDEGIAPDDLPLTVEVNQSGAVTYGE